MSDAEPSWTVAFKTLGCKVNQVESEAIAAALLGRGVAIVDESEARVIVVNTCTVTGEADAKARKAVRHALGRAGRPVVVVTGCLAALDAQSVAALSERVVVERDKDRIAQRVGALLGLDPVSAASPQQGRARFRTRAMLKIGDGCDAFCTYCIVPYARGAPRGVAAEQVVAEAHRLVAAGASEIVLTGINIGRYRDPSEGVDLSALIAAVAATGIPRLRLSSIEPRDLTERFISTVAATPAFCPHLHVPLQSGSDAVLASMGRDYTTAHYAGLVDEARDAISGLALTTDVIAGFPGETTYQAAQALAFCESLAFRNMHVFRYSARANTPAALRSDQVEAPEKSARALALRELSLRLWRQDVESHLGEARELLVEELVEDGTGQRVVAGRTRDYLRVRVTLAAAESDTLSIGDIVDVRLAGFESGRVAEVVSASLVR